MITATHLFPRRFLWGSVSSAYQVEGGNQGSDWRDWELTRQLPEAQQAGLACDWWGGRWAGDLDLAAGSGQNACRLSIEWSRVEPEDGRWDPGALDFYGQILRGALDRGLLPVVTLHHFSNPGWLAARGGWQDPAVVGLFERFVAKVAETLADLVGLWVTIQEPNVYIESAYQHGRFPPGLASPSAAWRAILNLVQAHSAAYAALHAIDPGCQVGVAHHYRGYWPAHRNNPLDAWATRLRSLTFNQLFPRAFWDGQVRYWGWRRRLPHAAQTQDFLALNYYTSEQVAFDPRRWRSLFARTGHRPGAQTSLSGSLANEPDGLWQALLWARRFQLPLYITGNGIEDARGHLRPSYIVAHLRQAWRAANANWQLRGYFHDALVDGFGWDKGWSEPFGLHQLNRDTQARSPRPSASLYAAICSSNSLSSEMVAQYAPAVFDELFPSESGISNLARAG